ncbi:MAG: 8-oxo-dGTP diphosphatase, partial [Mogibacterium sp.]|nr:8-oxo-dGTP diphosphatase [Mogibacterium sp.]
DTETLPECDEGILAWIPFEKIMELPLWEGDRIFLPRLINGENEINMSLYYEGDNLIKVIEG